MARPKPVILMRNTSAKTHKTEEILEAEAIYAVFLDGKPISIRLVNSFNNFPGPKYKKMSFPNSGHAFNLANKLNDVFKCDKFSVVKLTQGETVYEN